MQHQQSISSSAIIIMVIVLVNIIVLEQGYARNGNWYFILILTVPLLIFAIINVRQKKHPILGSKKLKRNEKNYSLQN